MAKPWTTSELATLGTLYPDGGSAAVHAALPHRSIGVIRVVAHRRGVKCNLGTGIRGKYSDVMINAAMASSGWRVSGAAVLLGCSTTTVWQNVKRQNDDRIRAIRVRKAVRQQQQ